MANLHRDEKLEWTQAYECLERDGNDINSIRQLILKSTQYVKPTQSGVEPLPNLRVKPIIINFLSGIKYSRDLNLSPSSDWSTSAATRTWIRMVLREFVRSTVIGLDYSSST